MKKDAHAVNEEKLAEAAEAILKAKYAIALTGAGMSVESGIPPFRGPGGLWTKYGEPPMNDFQVFMEDPKHGWEKRIERNSDELFAPLKHAKPNAGHYALVRLEEMGVLRFVITQNVDDLHRQAGQKALAEIHGNWKLIRCLDCVSRFSWEEVSLDKLPPRCPRCGGLLKADTVSFGEPIPTDVMLRCQTESAEADLVIVAGTSATVFPAAGFALEVKERGGALIEVNLYESEISRLCDVSLRGGSGEILPLLVERISKLRAASLS